MACIISATSPDNPGALCLFIFFNTALTSAILMQSAGPTLTSADILWSHSFSSFISFSMYSFHESLIPLSSTITFSDAPFIQFNPVICCLSLTICFALRKISFWHSESFKSFAHSFCFFSFAEEITLYFVCSSYTPSLPLSCFLSSTFCTLSIFP